MDLEELINEVSYSNLGSEAKAEIIEILKETIQEKLQIEVMTQ